MADKNAITKTTKFYVVFDESKMSYADFCKIAFECQRETRAFLNAASTEYTLYVRRMMDEYEQRGEWPKGAEVKTWYGVSLQTQLYRVAVPKTRILGSSAITPAINAEYGKWNKKFKEYVAGTSALPNFKANQPIIVNKSAVALSMKEGQEAIQLSFLSAKYQKEAGLKNGVFTFFAKWGKNDASAKAILDNCINGVYKFGAVSLGYDQKKRMWYCSMPYTIPKEAEAVGDGILGIDCGVVNAVYCAVNGSYDRMRISGAEIAEFRRRVEARRIDILRSRPYANPGSVGHGTKKRVEPAFQKEQQISDFRETKNKQYARKIVDFAVAHKCGVIQMEDLTGISTDNKFLKSWTYFDLQTRIEQAAAEFGITVIRIDPHYTSQRCSQCGYIDKENRPTQEQFQCVMCGTKLNADYNAARNIATPNIAEIIKRDLGANGE